MGRTFARDLLFGIRLLGRAPGFALVATLVVALGVGATTAIFSVAYGVLLRPLPFGDPARVVALHARRPDVAQRMGMNPADVRDLHATAVFEDVALANAPQNFNLLGEGEPERLVAGRLSANLLPVLRVAPALGRGFAPEDTRDGGARVTLLSDGLWRRRFGADPAIVGRTIDLSGTPHEVVGVMRPDFQFPARDLQFWIPLTIDPRLMARQTAGYGHVAVARLRPGVDLAQAQRELDAIGTRLEREHAATNRGVRLEVAPANADTVRTARPALSVLLAAVAGLLLVACLNLAGLLGARATARAREYAVRLALGASRGRLVVQALAEVAPVLALGGALGVAVARLAIGLFVPVAPPSWPRVDAIAIDGPVLAVSLAILALTGVVAGLLPAALAWRANPKAATIGSRAAIGGPAQARARRALVVAQLALALPLLVGATALARSFVLLSHVDPGFRPDHVLTMHLAIPRTKYPTDAEIAALYTRLVDRVATLPGVVSAGLVNRLPLSGNTQALPVAFEGIAGDPRPIETRAVTPDYFRTMGIALRDGRSFTADDRADAPLVAVVDDRTAQALWPGQRAVGRRFRVALPGQPPATGEIVGVVAAVRHRGLDGEAERQIHFGYQQFTDGRTALVVRTRGDAGAMGPSVAQAILAVDPDQPAYQVRTMNDVVARSVAPRWLNLAVVGVFATAALLLAGVGLYGIAAHGVSVRVREFGVRLALGAAPAAVAGLVLREGSRLAALGTLLGLGGALLLARAMESLLFGVEPFDPASFAIAAALLFAVALVASYLPARRAARTDPTQALRAE